MYGLIVKLSSTPGRRDELITLMGGEDSDQVPGCLSFVVARDAGDDDVLWISEVWSSQASHEASLAAPPIQQSLGNAEELIARYERIAVTAPVENSSRPLHGKAPPSKPRLAERE